MPSQCAKNPNQAHLPAPVENWKVDHERWENSELEDQWLSFCLEALGMRSEVVEAENPDPPTRLGPAVFPPVEWRQMSRLERAEVLGCPSPRRLADRGEGRTIYQQWRRWLQQAEFDSGALRWSDCWAIIEEEFDVLPESIVKALDMAAISRKFGGWVANDHRAPRDILLGVRAVVRRVARRPDQIGNPQSYLLRAVESESDFVEEEL